MCRRRLVRPMWLACTVSATFACGRRDAPPADSAAKKPSTVAVASAPSDWVSELGELFVVPSDSEQTGVVIFPATPSPRLVSSAPLTLLTTSGDSAAARASLVVSDSQV